MDEDRRRMEWGAEVQRDYSGWLEVAEDADGQSQVTVHLNFGERSVEPEMREPTSCSWVGLASRTRGGWACG